MIGVFFVDFYLACDMIYNQIVVCGAREMQENGERILISIIIYLKRRQKMNKKLFGFEIDINERIKQIVSSTVAEARLCESDEERISLVKRVVDDYLKNAMLSKEEISRLPEVDQKRIFSCFNGEVNTLTKALKNVYGICTQFHALALALFYAMGIPAEFWGNINYRHSFLRITIGGKEEIYDHFAEVIRRTFPAQCYDRRFSFFAEEDIMHV